jgi:hypothetical protein
MSATFGSSSGFLLCWLVLLFGEFTIAQDAKVKSMPFEASLSKGKKAYQLFRNLGDFKFKDVTQELGLKNIFRNHWAVGCSFVDINGDGWLDLFVAGTGDPNLVLISQSGESFVESSAKLGLNRKGASVQMAFADFDRDGDLDGYLVTNRLSS